MATIKKREDSYLITVSCGYDVNNKQIRRYKTWKPTPGMTARQIDKEVQRQAVLFEEKCLSGQVLDGSIKFADFTKLWLQDYAEKRLRPTTLARYKSLMPRVNVAIGHLRLEKIQPHHLMAFYDNLAEENVRGDVTYKCIVDLKPLLKRKSRLREDFARLANISPSTLKSAVNGKNISKASANKIATTLELPLCELFTPANENQTLSESTILYYHRLISSVMAQAVKWQMIISNPCSRATIPKAKKKEAAYLDESEAAKMLKLLDGESVQNRTIVKLLLYTGLRRGELCGLEWKDVDLNNAIIRIRRSSLYLPGKGIFTDDTKNETSERSIKIPHDAVLCLCEQRSWQLQEKLKLGDQWHEHDRIFTTWNGDPKHPDTITSWFRKFAKKNNLPQVHVHSLRHTNATLLIAAGTNLQTVANRLGHADTTTTSKIYAHAIKSADEAAAEVLEDILNPTKKKA